LFSDEGLSHTFDGGLACFRNQRIISSRGLAVLALAHGLSECADEPVLLSLVELVEEDVVGEVCCKEELDPSLPGVVGFLMGAGGDAIGCGFS
jgi:hypothetical protein